MTMIDATSTYIPKVIGKKSTTRMMVLTSGLLRIPNTHLKTTEDGSSRCPHSGHREKVVNGALPEFEKRPWSVALIC